MLYVETLVLHLTHQFCMLPGEFCITYKFGYVDLSYAKSTRELCMLTREFCMLMREFCMLTREPCSRRIVNVCN